MQTLSCSVFFVVQIGVVLHDSSRNQPKNNLTCPDPNEWPARQEEFKCDNEGKVYICILNKENQTTEACVYEYFVNNGTDGCPFISIREGSPGEVIISHPESFRTCDEDLPGCPPKYHGGYKLSEIYKYEACTKGIRQTPDSVDTTYTDGSTESSTTIANIKIGYNAEYSTTIIIILTFTILWKIVIIVAAVLTYKQRGQYTYRSRNFTRFGTRIDENSDTLLKTIVVDDDLTTIKSPKEIVREFNGYLKRCDYKKLEYRYAECLKEFTSSNPTLVCDLDFLKFHSDIYQGKYIDAENAFDDMMARCRSLRNSLFHEVTLLTARMRLFVHTGEREKLEQTFNNIFEKIEKDSCLSNQNFGWVYFNFSRYNQEMIIQALREEKIDEAKTFVDEAEKNIDKAIQYFSDKQFSDEAKRSQGLAILEKIALKLRWFGKDNHLDRLKPQKGDIECCNEHLLEYKYLDIPTENDTEIKLQLLKTKTIFAFRAGLRNNMKEKLRKLESMIIKNKRKGMLRELKVMKQIMLNT